MLNQAVKFTIREGWDEKVLGWSAGLWNALEIGILLTDLDHKSLMCNEAFGELFGIDPSEVVRDEVGELRDRVIPGIDEPDAWLANLDEIYSDPRSTQRDEISMCAQSKVLERFTAPVFDEDGRVVARLWTFRKANRGAPGIVFVGSLRLDSSSRQVMSGDEEVDLTKFEFDLLELLMRNAGTAMGREILFRRVWGYDITMNTNSLDVLISRLRKKVGCKKGIGVKIETVYGYGYRLDPCDEPCDV